MRACHRVYIECVYILCVHAIESIYAIDEVAWLGIKIPDINLSGDRSVKRSLRRWWPKVNSFKGNDCSKADSP